MISYLLPTHSRPGVLAATLEALGRLPCHAGEVIVIDNAGDPPAAAPSRLDNGLTVRVVHLDANRGASARNHGAELACGEWLVMLDDDSHPVDAGHFEVLAAASPETAAVGAEIRLPDGTREAGGLPEVFVGCGAAVRRRAFLAAGGYDPAFGYYAEEYDLCARLILAGWWITHDMRFRVHHGKVAGGRDMDRIVHNLVRNNGWVMQRYAPAHLRRQALCEVIARYGEIALRENAAWGYARGMSELSATRARQPSRPMSVEQFDRFTGAAHVRAVLAGKGRVKPGMKVAVVEPGKNACIVRQVLQEIGARIIDDPDAADALIIGTLSPGPMLDAQDRAQRLGLDAVAPWNWERAISDQRSAISDQWVVSQPPSLLADG